MEGTCFSLANVCRWGQGVHVWDEPHLTTLVWVSLPGKRLKEGFFFVFSSLEKFLNAESSRSEIWLYAMLVYI